MKELTFDSGIVEYKINGAAVVAFNPADRAFVERFYNTFDALEKTQDEYSKKAAALEDHRGSFALAHERDDAMTEILDGLFHQPVCQAVFGDMSLCAFANGFPVWLNLMLIILDEIEGNIGDIQKQADPRIAKYKAKYAKYAAKFQK